MLTVLGLIFGLAVGLALGLTGGGGSLLAVPMLVYGLSVSPRQAVGASLAAVGAVAAMGAVQRWRAKQLELVVGGIFAVGGVAGAPLGSWIGRSLPPSAMMAAFAGLMVFIAIRMWLAAVRNPRAAAAVRARLDSDEGSDSRGPACAYEPSGKLRLTGRCGWRLVAAGLAAGVLSGLFGVGGGFIIVPALVLLTGMSAHRAVATSLMVIVFVSASGLVSFLVGGGELPVLTTSVFVAGGIGGMTVGTAIAKRLSPVAMQKIFAAAILVLAAYILVRTALAH